MKFTKVSTLTKEIRHILNEDCEEKFPVVLTINLGMEHPTFVITIEQHEVDTYTDSTGQKWKKVK